ncbi:MAG: hypothetical protein Q7S52_02165 [bacterium]|nr:hypothetical protein [bacterium]
MQALLALLKTPRTIALILAGSVAAVALVHTTPPPLFPTTDQFVLFATEQLTLEQDTQVSSGNLGSNDTLAFDKNVLATSDLFGKTITLDKGAVINGNAFYRKIKKHADAQILGAATGGVQLPIANLPVIPDLTFGTTSLTTAGTTTTLTAGNYRDITIQKGSTLTLLPGAYTVRSLELKDNATLIFNASTTINIGRALKGGKRVSVLPGQHTAPDQLTINYNGFKSKNEKNDSWDNDNDASDSFDDEKERKDWQKGKVAQPVLFGERSFLNFKLLAPKANVIIGKESTLRGQVVARKIRMEKGSILSREEFFSKDADVTKIVSDSGTRVIANEIVLILSDTATINDIQPIVNVVSGRIVGFLDVLRMAKVEIQATTVTQLHQAVDTLKALRSPFIKDVGINFIFD